MKVKGFPGGSVGKESACIVGDLDLLSGWENPLEEGMVTHSSILAWRIPWIEEPGRLQSIGGSIIICKYHFIALRFILG